MLYILRKQRSFHFKENLNEHPNTKSLTRGYINIYHIKYIYATKLKIQEKQKIHFLKKVNLKLSFNVMHSFKFDFALGVQISN